MTTTVVEIPKSEWTAPRGSVSERPWWHHEGHGHGLARTDGARILSCADLARGVNEPEPPPGACQLGLPPDWLAPAVSWAALRDETRGKALWDLVPITDERFPVPFPGVRDGQIWWKPADRHPVTLHHPWVLVDHWFAGGERLHRRELEVVLRSCILLHDPLRPETAPWAPPGVTLARSP